MTEDHPGDHIKGSSQWYRRMVARDVLEAHRQATPLELFFDLCFVVAVAFAADDLHHSIVEDRITYGFVHYVAVFFGIWWAWMNFTWFASAYDNDDILYRIATFVQMTGVLILAAGTPRIFAQTDFSIATLGYVVMRLAMVPQWLRASHSDPPRRNTAKRYALAITLVQFGWVCLLLLPESWRLPGFVTFAALELLIPVYAESAAPTTWHHYHIGERYGLFTLIVLGETVLVSTIAIQSAMDAGHDKLNLLLLSGAGLLTVFSMWWLYFDRPSFEPTEATGTSLRAFVWGYGHLPLFASIAAVGAGFAVAIDREIGVANLTSQSVALAIAVPVAVYLVTVWAIHMTRRTTEIADMAMAAGACVALACAAAGLPVHFIALTITIVAIVKVSSTVRAQNAP